MTSLEAKPDTNPPEDDSDLEDLLSSPKSKGKKSVGPVEETRSLKSSLDGVATQQRQGVNMFDFLIAYIGYLILNKPRLIAAVVCLFFLALIVVVNLTLRNDSVRAIDPIIETDYSDIKSKYDLSVGRINHWCLSGDDDTCRCEDPLQPIDKSRYRNWQKAHDLNKDSVKNKIRDFNRDDDETTDVDVLFIGENIVEAWAGRAMSYNTTNFRQIKDSFDSRFNKEKGGKYDGLALGIAGDTAPNVLWRIKNGELPENLNPKVIWLLIGTNDLSLKQCSEEVVLLGILRVIEEIEALKPNTKIVVTGILPMTSDEKGRVPPFSYKQLQKNKRKRNNPRQLDVLETSDKDEDTENTRKFKGAVITVGRRNPFHRMRISMWPSVIAVNEQLKRFCSKHSHMVFFDPYNVFVEKLEENKFPTIKPDFMKAMAFGIPSLMGHQEMHKAAERKLNFIFNKRGKRTSKKPEVVEKQNKTELVEDKESTQKESNEDKQNDEDEDDE